MYCISISHKAAPLLIREKFAFSLEQQKAFSKKVVNDKHVSGCIVLSTCNRSEVYFTGDKKAVAVMEDEIANFKDLQKSEVLKYYRVYGVKQAAHHLFQVASGLDSMVIGEDEILGQVKKAYQTALEIKTTDYELNILFHSAITSAKKVKSLTLLSKTPISIGTLVAHEIFNFPKKDKKVLIIGLTGKMGTIIMKNVAHRSDVELTGTTRQHGYHMSVVSKEIKIIHYSERYDYINEADIIISATTSPHYTLTYDEVVKAATVAKKRLFIDLAVPSDIDGQIGLIEDTKLYDIDYFEVLSKQNNETKLKEVEKGQLIIEEEVENAFKKIYFHEWIENIDYYRDYFRDKNIEQVLYQLRDEASSEELKTILEVIKRVTKEKEVDIR